MPIINSPDYITSVLFIFRKTMITTPIKKFVSHDAQVNDCIITNILHEIRKWKANWIGHILRRNCLLKQVIKGKIKGEMEVARRQGRRRKELLDDLKDRRGYSHLKEEALDHTMWRHRFGGFGPVVRHNTE